MFPMFPLPPLRGKELFVGSVFALVVCIVVTVVGTVIGGYDAFKVFGLLTLLMAAVTGFGYFEMRKEARNKSAEKKDEPGK